MMRYMTLWESHITVQNALRRKVVKFCAGFIVVLVLLTIIASLPLPLSSCAAPWSVQLDGDQATPNWIACVTDLARRTGRVSFCDTFSGRFLHDDCVTAV